MIIGIFFAKYGIRVLRRCLLPHTHLEMSAAAAIEKLLYYWIKMIRPIERWVVESDIRFRIDALFREAGIVIAFPQQDTHLDTQRPLEVRLLNPNKE